ncbi:proteoglycan 4-like [Littorina saxatilis]|uniref:proteoglycan 4-like n=1 Tax=Littorina saxatilis TaxID=31220 RepID=UPI0038B59578
MTPEVPPGSQKVKGDKPEEFVQISNVGPGVFVEDVPKDDAQPDTKVYKSVEPDNDRFTPKAGQPILVTVKEGETPATPIDGSRTPQDVVAKEPSKLVASLPTPDGGVLKVYEVTPENDTPIAIKDPQDVLEPVTAGPDGDFPVNKDGPTTVIVVDSDNEPREVLSCEKVTTGTTAGPTVVTPTVGPTTGPTTQGPTTGPPTEGPTTGPTSAPTTEPTAAPPTAGPTTGPPTEGPTTGPTSAPTTGPTETVTGCPQEMTPEVPAGSEKVKGDKPGEFVQISNVGPGVFVEDVPKDGDQPDTKVYKSVEPDNNDRFTPKAGQPILVTVKEGETPATPNDGSRTPQDVVAKEPSKLVASLPTPDGGVLKVYEVTPNDETPIAIEDPQDVLEPVTAGPDGDFPVNKDGPTTVIVVDSDNEPREVLSCEKVTTGTTAGPTVVTPTVGPTTGPTTQGPTTGPPTEGPTIGPTSAPTTEPTAAPPTAGPTTGPPTEGPTTGPTSAPTTGPTETVTGCPQEMTPEVPAGSEKVKGDKPGEFVQISNVGPGVFVEDVPKDGDQPDTKVYKSVEPDNNDRFTPKAGQPILVTVKEGETPATPNDGSRTPQDVVAKEPSKLVASLPTPDGGVLKVYEVTPNDETPIAIEDPQDVLEPVTAGPDGDFPVNKDGPTTVIVVDSDNEPREVLSCEKVTTGTTAGPTVVTPTVGPTTGPTTQGPTTGPPTAGPTTGPPTEGPTTGPTSAPTTGPTETVTGCPQEMTPEVPAGSEKVKGDKPGEFVQISNVGPGVFVEDVPKDGDQPDTKVYKSVEPDNNDRFTPKAGQPILVTVKEGETPATPNDGSRTPQDVVAKEPSKLVASLPTPDGGVLKVYEVTPNDETPIAIEDPQDVLEPVTAGPDGDFPVNKDGPTTVIVVDSDNEPREVLSCEKVTTGTTAGPTVVTPTVGPTTGPTTQGPTTGPPTEGPTTGPTSAPTTEPTAAPPTAGPTTGPPTEGPTTGPTSAPTTGPTGVDRSCSSMAIHFRK